MTPLGPMLDDELLSEQIASQPDSADETVGSNTSDAASSPGEQALEA